MGARVIQLAERAAEAGSHLEVEENVEPEVNAEFLVAGPPAAVAIMPLSRSHWPRSKRGSHKSA